MLNIEYWLWMLNLNIDFEYWILNLSIEFEYWIWVLNVECWILNIEYWLWNLNVTGAESDIKDSGSIFRLQTPGVFVSAEVLTMMGWESFSCIQLLSSTDGGKIPSSRNNDINCCRFKMWDFCCIWMDLLILSRLQGPSRVGVDCLEDGELISYCSFDDLIYMDLLGVWLGWMRTHFKYICH